jgi:hypothetical protein
MLAISFLLNFLHLCNNQQASLLVWQQALPRDNPIVVGLATKWIFFPSPHWGKNEGTKCTLTYSLN